MTQGANFDLNARQEAAACANAEDAAVWRWFSDLYDQGLIRWCRTDRGWLVSVADRHVATTATFDEGIREAMARTQDADLPRNKKKDSSNREEKLR
ncbi:hypothetical protein [Paraburkholderia sp. GAS32]|uniref:hypothetical protein n=1 Tax=Paraburkholderia sp. GAS32 TaxID=3035129 RepID=UPI003D2401FE